MYKGGDHVQQQHAPLTRGAVDDDAARAARAGGGAHPGRHTPGRRQHTRILIETRDTDSHVCSRDNGDNEGQGDMYAVRLITLSLHLRSAKRVSRHSHTTSRAALLATARTHARTRRLGCERR